MVKVRTQAEVNAEFQAGVDRVTAARNAKKKAKRKKAVKKRTGGLAGTGNYLTNPRKYRENQERYPKNK